MELQEIFQKMSSGELAAHSELGTRDESKQSKNFGTRIRKMKTVTGINARAMVMKDVVIPFNPFTGEADNTYNRKTPFRPILLVSQVIEGLKSACAQNENLRNFWEKELNIKFSDGAATMEEYAAFKARGYIKPRVMSYSTVAMNFGGAHGFPDFRVKYTVDPTELNEQGTYDYNNAPIWHQAAIFFNSMLKPEADEIKRKLEASGANKEVVQTQRRAAFAKSPVGFVGPTNLIPYLFFPLDEAPRSFDANHPQELESVMRFYSFTDKWTVPLKEAMEKPMYDENMDFFDFTIKTPSATDTKKNGQVYTDEDANELYAAMTITNTDGRLALKGGRTDINGVAKDNEEVYAPIYAQARAYFQYSQEQSGIEGGESFEKIMAASNRFRPITVALPSFLPACNDVFVSTFANTKYFTDEVKKANSDFFTALNPQNALALADADDDELKEASDAQRASVAAMISEQNGDVQSGDADILGVSGINQLDLEDA